MGSSGIIAVHAIVRNPSAPLSILPSLRIIQHLSPYPHPMPQKTISPLARVHSMVILTKHRHHHSLIQSESAPLGFSTP